MHAKTGIVSYSPLRVSFGGGGTDIPPFPERYGGAALNTTIDLGVTVSYSPDKMPLELSSRDYVRSLIVSTRKGSGMEGIMSMLEKHGIVQGRVRINGDVPPGSGLASSSAMMTAISAMLLKASGAKLAPEAIAKAAYDSERKGLGVLLGMQDPYAIAHGGFKFMSFEGEMVRVERFPKRSGFIEELMSRVLLVYTGRSRYSGAILGEQASAAAKGDSRTIESLISLKEVALDLREAVMHDDIEAFCAAVNRGWRIKKGLGSSVSNDSVDAIIRRGMLHGAAAGRLLGGGSQGFVLFIAKEGRLGALQDSMLRISDFAFRTGLDVNGTRILSR
jgi:D-glycero-alpha-D-manno-heptose-7-phosphate kinase